MTNDRSLPSLGKVVSISSLSPSLHDCHIKFEIGPQFFNEVMGTWFQGSLVSYSLASTLYFAVIWSRAVVLDVTEQDHSSLTAGCFQFLCMKCVGLYGPVMYTKVFFLCKK